MSLLFLFLFVVVVVVEMVVFGGTVFTGLKSVTRSKERKNEPVTKVFRGAVQEGK